MADELGTLSFIPWLRRGLAAGITRPDGPIANTSQHALDVTLTLNAGVAQTELALVEPGAIVGLDARAIARTFPQANETDAEFRHLVMVELDQADLPWRYTPAAAADERLRPWLTLVVLIDQEEVAVTAPTQNQKLAVATVRQASLLPNLNEAWAFAHVQVHGAADASSVPALLSGSPGQVLARLVSPRVLTSNTTYQALIVPTYARGRLAGTGVDPGTTDLLELAWDNASSAPVTLPVYYQWRFQTGAVGSFEDLIRALTPRELPATVGRRAMDVTRPGLGLPSASSTPLGAEGALQSLAAAANPPVWNPAERAAWTTALANVLNLASVSLAGTGLRRIVAPPLYGRWHAAVDRLAQPNNPPWFFDLNDDPRLRVAAATGTAVVQAHDQELMESAWRQVGDLKAINEERRVLQVGREAFVRGYDRHVRTGHFFSFLSVTSAMHPRVVFGTGTVFSLFGGSRIGRGVLEPQWRRLARPRGFIGRRQGQPALPGSATADFLDRLNDGRLDPAVEPPMPAGIATWGRCGGALVPGGLSPGGITTLSGLGRDPLTFWGMLFFCVARTQLISNPGRKWWWLLRMMRFGLALLRLAIPQQQTIVERIGRLRDGTFTLADLSAPPAAPDFTWVSSVPSPLPPVLAPPAPGAVDSPAGAGFRGALTDLVSIFRAPRPVRPGGITIDLGNLRDVLGAALHPSITLVESMIHRIRIHPSVFWQAADPLEPIMPAPEFPQPMYAPLRDLSQEWILPGISQVEPDTLAVLLTNQRFVESYMVGLSHEMARELLWNEYPTDQRGTYFRQFWDHRGYVPGPNETFDPEAFRDIRVIHGWPKNGQLGANSPRRPPPGGQHLVLLVRGELIRRYPNVIVYAARSTDLAADELHPVFSGRIGADVGFYGFELTVNDVRGNPGWFFVLQEQPAEPRLRPPDVSTGQRHVTVAAAGNPPTAASLAEILLQQPTRVAVHGLALIPVTP
jgi:hypothetical protein